MKRKDVIATLFLGTGAFIFSNAIYNAYVLRKPKYPFKRALLTSGIFLFVGCLIAKSFEQPEEAENEEEKLQYSGVILDPEKVRETCYCEPVCSIHCYAKGAIGSLSKEQVKKYCYDKYEKVREELKKVSGK